MEVQAGKSIFSYSLLIGHPEPVDGQFCVSAMTRQPEVEPVAASSLLPFRVYLMLWKLPFCPWPTALVVSKPSHSPALTPSMTLGGLLSGKVGISEAILLTTKAALTDLYD